MSYSSLSSPTELCYLICILHKHLLSCLKHDCLNFKNIFNINIWLLTKHAVLLLIFKVLYILFLAHLTTFFFFRCATSYTVDALKKLSYTLLSFPFTLDFQVLVAAFIQWSCICLIPPLEVNGTLGSSGPCFTCCKLRNALFLHVRNKDLHFIVRAWEVETQHCESMKASQFLWHLWMRWLTAENCF